MREIVTTPNDSTLLTNVRDVPKSLKRPKATIVDSKLLSSNANFLELVTLRIYAGYCVSSGRAFGLHFAGDDMQNPAVALPPNNLCRGRPCPYNTCNTPIDPSPPLCRYRWLFTLHNPGDSLRYRIDRCGVPHLLGRSIRRGGARCKLWNLLIGAHYLNAYGRLESHRDGAQVYFSMPDGSGG